MVATRLDGGRHFGSLVSARQFGDIASTESAYPPEAILPTHAHTTSYFCLVVSGNFEEHAGKNLSHYGAHSVLYRPADDAHRQSFGRDGALCFALAIPDRLAARVTGARLLDPRRDYGDTPAVTLMHAARREHRRPDSASTLCVEGLLFELLAYSIRAPYRSLPAPALRHARAMLAASPARPLALAEIAREVNVEPAALARAFKREFGCSMADLSRRFRLQSAVRALLESNRPISVIAAEHGFYDQSHFGRHCRREFGLAPKAVRKAGRIPIRTSSVESS